MTVSHRYCYIAVILLSIVGCRPAVIYDQQSVVVEEGWSYRDSLTYQFDVSDTIQQYDIVVTIVHSDAFSYENLYAMINTTFPDGRLTAQQLSLQLTDIADAWLGKCKGEDCTVEIPIASNRRFKEAGTYGISIAQHSRVADLVGIKSLGLRVQESKN